MLEFESIYQNIIQAKDKQINLLNANVYNAELLFKGLQLKLKTIQEHFAQECAISRVAENSLEGAGLTPNLSPIIMSRKPLSEKTVAENCLKWGTGGINIDESRVLGDKGNGNWKGQQKDSTSIFGNGGKEYQGEQSNLGRFPANLIHDGSEEVVSLFPNDSQRFFYCAKASKSERNRGCDGLIDKKAPKLKSISNFCIKCGKREDYKCNCNVGFEYKEQPNYQNITKNNHPTVKPVSLMQYLVRLVTRK